MQGITGEVVDRNVDSMLPLLVMLVILLPTSASTAQNIDAWDLGIMYPEDDADIPFQISRDGTAKIEFFVDNSGLVEISIQFEYDVPFGGEQDGPEDAIIPAGSNESFDLKISEIDVFNFEARQVSSFSITATVTARQGVPNPLPLNSQQNEEGELIIPTIYDLTLNVADPIGPMNAGTDTILRVTVTNTGNSQDKVGDVEVSDECPLLSTDNGLDALMVGSLDPGKSKNADLTATASESHPRRHCDITVTVTSNGAMNAGQSVVISDEVRVSIEPPPTESEEDDGTDDVDDNPIESVKSNLPAPGILISAAGMIAALICPPRRRAG